MVTTTLMAMTPTTKTTITATATMSRGGGQGEDMRLQQGWPWWRLRRPRGWQWRRRVRDSISDVDYRDAEPATTAAMRTLKTKKRRRRTWACLERDGVVVSMDTATAASSQAASVATSTMQTTTTNAGMAGNADKTRGIGDDGALFLQRTPR